VLRHCSYSNTYYSGVPGKHTKKIQLNKIKVVSAAESVRRDEWLGGKDRGPQ